MIPVVNRFDAGEELSWKGLRLHVQEASAFEVCRLGLWVMEAGPPAQDERAEENSRAGSVDALTSVGPWTTSAQQASSARHRRGARPRP